MSFWQNITKTLSGGNDAGNNGGETVLVEAARRGDARAFDALVGSYQAQLKGFIARRVPTEAVDDLAQDVWIGVWNALPRFERRACFRTFLYGVAVHKCMDFHRGQKKHAGNVPAELLTEGTLNAALANTPPSEVLLYKTPEELYTAAESRETVRVVVDTLPEAQREVLDLYYWAELTLPEIARALNRNLNTVKYQFYRGHDLVAQGMAGMERMAAVSAAKNEKAFTAPQPRTQATVRARN